MGYEIYDKYIDENYSGAKESRPDFDRLMNDMRQHKFQGIVVYKLDRIGGSLQHLLQLFEEFKNNNIQFISVTQNINTDTPEGRYFLKSMMLMAEYERELTVARTRDTLDRYKEQLETQGYYIARDGKKKTSLGRPIGKKDSSAIKRRRSGYIKRRADTPKKRHKQITPPKIDGVLPVKTI
jgi:site-specific DNA recombinase